MESLPLASCPKHIPDGVGDCPLGGSGPAAFRAYSLPWLGQVFLEFPPQWPRHPEVVHFRRCGSLSHKAHLLSRMVMVAIPFSERCVFVQGSQGSSRIESKAVQTRLKIFLGKFFLRVANSTTSQTARLLRGSCRPG